MISEKELGFLGENIAARYLMSKGYVILAKSYRKRWAEIDIIARIDQTIAFVEVKTNATMNASFNPELRVNYQKLKKIAKLADFYIQQEVPNSEKEIEWRIDIISVMFPSKSKAKVVHFKNVSSAD